VLISKDKDPLNGIAPTSRKYNAIKRKKERFFELSIP